MKQNKKEHFFKKATLLLYLNTNRREKSRLLFIHKHTYYKIINYKVAACTPTTPAIAPATAIITFK